MATPRILGCVTFPNFQDITGQLLETGHFDVLTPRVDEDEHSIEMHLPFIKKVFTSLTAYLLVPCPHYETEDPCQM